MSWFPIRVWFPAIDGDDLDLDVSWFVCDDWEHPPVIGWRGCLQWIRFGLNPDENAFYFAQTLGLNPE